MRGLSPPGAPEPGACSNGGLQAVSVKTLYRWVAQMRCPMTASSTLPVEDCVARQAARQGNDGQRAHSPGDSVKVSKQLKRLSLCRQQAHTVSLGPATELLC